MVYYLSILGGAGGEGTHCGLFGLQSLIAVCSYFHTTMLYVFSNIIGGFILLHFDCDSEVPTVGKGYTISIIITECVSVCACVCNFRAAKSRKR